MTTVGQRRVALAERADALRRLHTRERPFVLPNAWDVAGARLVVKAGFPVVATSSGAIAATLGYEDNDSMPVDEAFGVIARIARSVPVPVTADVEAGYRLSPEDLVESPTLASAVAANVFPVCGLRLHGGPRPLARPADGSSH
jgi:2-methylisocitrate lyase-like PEP mutase family enzyme